MTGGKRSCPGPAGQHSLILPDPGATKKVTSEYPTHRDVGGITGDQGILWAPHSKEAIMALLRKTAAWGAAAVGAVARVQYGALSEPIGGN